MSKSWSKKKSRGVRKKVSRYWLGQYYFKEEALFKWGRKKNE